VGTTLATVAITTAFSFVASTVAGARLGSTTRFVSTVRPALAINTITVVTAQNSLFWNAASFGRVARTAMTIGAHRIVAAVVTSAAVVHDDAE